MNQIQIAAYLYELRDCADSALFLLDQLEEAAAEWVRLHGQLRKTNRRGSSALRDQFVGQLVASGRQQALIFDALEAFLAVWARTSLIIFPGRGKPSDPMAGFRKQRGKVLRDLLGLKYPKVLKNRTLRDAWMHFDERLDRAVSDGTWGSRQRFAMSYEVGESPAHVLRLVAVDTLTVYYRTEDGASASTSLVELRAALEDLQIRLKKAWERSRKLPTGLPENEHTPV